MLNNLMSKKIFYFVLTLAVFLAGGLVRLYKIGNPVADWHSWRQADTAAVSRIYVEEGISPLYPRYYDISSIQSGKTNPKGYRFVEFPFYNIVHAAIYKSYPSISLEMWGRILSSAYSLVSAYFVMLIGRKYLGHIGGILSAFFFLLIPYNIYFSRVILPEPMGIMFLTAGLWVFVKFAEQRKLAHFYLSCLALSMSLLIKPFFAFYFLPLIYLFYQRIGIKKAFENKKELFKYLAGAMILFVPFIVWRMWENNFPEGIPFFEWAFNGDGIRFRPAFWRWIFGVRLGELILGIFGLIPFAIGVITKKKEELFYKLSILGMLFYVITVATANVRHDYYQIITIPAVSWILAAGAVKMWEEKYFHQLTSRIILVFSLFMLFFLGWLRIRDFYQINHPEIIEVGARVDEIAPKDAMVVAPYNGDTAFLYHTKRFGWPAVDNSIENIVAQGADYYVSLDLESKDTLDFQKKFEILEKTGRYIILDLHDVKSKK
jgi:hypothetical protein